MLNLRKNIALMLILFIILLAISNTVNAATNLISMSKVTISNILDQKYTGAYIKPNVVVRYNGKTLTKDIDYSVSYSNNRNTGRATVKITGKGIYIGTRTMYFNIVNNRNTSLNKISMSNASLGSISNQIYTGKYIKPSITVRYNGKVLEEGTDYTLSYSNNINVGTATIKITGKGNYTGTKTAYFKIVRKPNYISNTTISNIPDQTYTGNYIKPSVVIRYNGEILEEGTDYTVSYSNNKYVGTATIKITGKGNYTGTKTVTFKIVRNTVSISNATVSNILNQTYTGNYIKPSVVIRYNGEKLVEGTDYTVSYSNNKNVGTATVKITGRGNYTGTKTVTFKIIKNSSYIETRSISKVTVERIYDYTYTGRYIEPEVVVRYDGEKLVEGRDYTVSYSNNKNVGTATIKITGKGNYTGTKTIYFKIAGKSISISNATVSNILNQTYTGKYIKPSVVVRYDGEKLEEGTDYTVSYSNNKNVGTATVKITGRGNYTGTKTVTFKIVDSDYSYSSNKKISLSNVIVSNILNQLYTGNYIKPNVVVRYNGNKLTQGTDYTVSYSNNKNVGTATVKITGKGNYTGTKTVTFKIVKR